MPAKAGPKSRGRMQARRVNLVAINPPSEANSDDAETLVAGLPGRAAPSGADVPPPLAAPAASAWEVGDEEDQDRSICNGHFPIDSGAAPDPV